MASEISEGYIFYKDSPSLQGVDLQRLVKFDHADKSVQLSEENIFGGSTFNPSIIYSASLEGLISLNYVDDFYYRIHIEPRKLELGNILSLINRDIKVWNSYFETKQLTNYLEPSIEGLEVIEPVTPNYDIKPLEELTYQTVVTAEGPNQFNVAISLVISGETFTVRILGSRVVPWAFRNDWRYGVRRRLSWKTDVLYSKSGKEQRRRVRFYPRMIYEVAMQVATEERDLFSRLLMGWQNRAYATPLWEDMARLTQTANSSDDIIYVDTRYRNFTIGNLAIVINSSTDYEVFEVLEVEDSNLTLREPLINGWNEGSKVYPLMIALLPQSQDVTNLTSQVSQSLLTWQCLPVESDVKVEEGSEVETFNSKEVFYKRANWRVNPSVKTLAPRYELDSNTSYISYSPKTDYVISVWTLTVTLKSKIEIFEFLKFLNRRAGRFSEFYFSTEMRDFTLYESIGVSSTSFKIKPVKHSQYINLNLFKGVEFLLNDGSKIRKTIVGSSDADPNFELISVDLTDPFTQQIQIENIKRMSFLFLARLESDDVDIDYLNSEVAECTLQIRALEQ